MWWIYANLQEVGINAEDYIEEVEKPAFSINLFLLGIGFYPGLFDHFALQNSI